MDEQRKAHPEQPRAPKDLDQEFRTTHWSVILLAAQAHSPESAAALEQLCHTYWSPLYAFVRRHGHGPEEAKDLTQEFFLHVLRKGALTKVDRDKGRFRSFLLSSIKNLLANEWHRARAQKRGGHVSIRSVDEYRAEEQFRLEPATHLTPDKLFDRRWTEALLERVLERVRDDWNGRDKRQRFEELKVFLVERRGTAPMPEVAARLGVTMPALRSMLHRLRASYRKVFTQEIARTVASPEDVEDEIKHLLAALND